MNNRERAAWIALVFGLGSALALRGGTVQHAAPPSRPRATPGVRVSMAALHRQGGVPMGWQLTPPPGDAAAGRVAFADLGCPSCHKVAGEPFAPKDGEILAGPELTGMGGSHPPAYFAEAILNPDAVLVDGPAYVDSDGRSTMPAYPELTIGDLGDLVAYLASLRAGAAQSCHAPGAPADDLTVSNVNVEGRPRPATAAGVRFFSQTYDVLPGQLEAFEAWFDGEGRRRFLDTNGLVSVDTFVDVLRPNGTITSVFGFRDEAAMRNFLRDPGTAALWQRFDAFVGPHGHLSTDDPPVYRAPSLSGE